MPRLPQVWVAPTPDSLKAALSSIAWSEVPDESFGPSGTRRSRSYAVVIRTVAPTRSEGVSGIQGTFVFHTNRWSGAQTQLHQARRIITLILAPSGRDMFHKSRRVKAPTSTSVSLQQSAVSSVQAVLDQSASDFDAPFSEPELVRAPAQCSDSATSLDGLPYSAFQVNLDWWRQMMLDFFNPVLAWNFVPSVWKSSEVVPVFKQGQRTNPDNYRPISLASCAFLVVLHVVRDADDVVQC